MWLGKLGDNNAFLIRINSYGRATDRRDRNPELTAS